MIFLGDVLSLSPSGSCLAVPAAQLWLTAASNLVIAAAFLCVAAALVSLLARHDSTQAKAAIGLFAASVAACGVAHLLVAVTLCAPLPSIRVVADVVTAVLSVTTTILIWPTMEKLLGSERESRDAQSAGQTIQRALEALAMQDSLTGLANRRHFDEAMAIEIRRARRNGTPVALIMIDADLFKPFNDTYGHAAGDACLRAVAKAMLGQLRRPGDLGARIGGDEFAAILPATDEAGAGRIAQAIVNAIDGLGILHPLNPSGMVTASAGVAAILPPGLEDLAQRLFEQADAALYVAKERGGNQVHAAGDIERERHRDRGLRDAGDATRGGVASLGAAAPRMPGGVDFVSILRGLPLGVLVSDSSQPDDPIVFANDSFVAMTGFSVKEIVGRNSRFLQGAGTDPKTVAEIAAAIAQGAPIRRDLLNYGKDGRPFWNDLSVQPLRDRQGAVLGFVGLMLDQTARVGAEQARRDAEIQLASLVENLPGYIFQRVLKANGELVYSYFSQSYWRLLGFADGADPAGVDPYANIHPADVEGARTAVARSMAELSPCIIEFRAVRADGSLLWIRSHSTPRRLDEAGTMAWDGVGIDISAEMASKEQLAYLAYHDPLTGLCNRVLFLKTLSDMCAARTAHPRRLAIVSVDLHSLQSINDAHGTSTGDAVLRAIAERLGAFGGAGAVAARLGGDEFGLAIADLAAETPLADLANGLARALQAPMRIREREITVRVTVGATLHLSEPGDMRDAEDTAEELFKQVHVALADARRAGSGAVRLYSQEADERERNRGIIRYSLERALQEREFIVHYHPIVDLVTGRILGAEALVRWAHPGLGMQRPDLFIPEAEASGLIVPLGAWVMRTALHELQKWRTICQHPLRIAINVSAVQLLDPGFIAALDDMLEETSADPGMVELELTESALIGASALDVLVKIRARGLRLAVDDFGTGYSSFRYLQTLPITAVKIDQGFVRHMVINSSDASIVRAIAAVAKSLNLEVVAEGIENNSQRDFLRDEGCRIGQGYLFSLPLAAEDFRWLLASDATLPPDEAYAPEHGSRVPAGQPLLLEQHEATS